MRSRVTRLAGLAAGAALAVSSLAIAGPAHAAPGEGTLNISIVDDLGKPVNGVVILFPKRGEEEGSIDPIIIAGDEGAENSYSRDIPAGTYGLLTAGGWNLMSCVGLTSCDDLMSEEEPEVAGNGAFTVPEGGVVNFKITTPAPKLIGSGKIGAPLYADVPSLMDGDRMAFLSVFGEEILFLDDEDFEPGIVWKRDGVRIPGATGATYVPSVADAGARITADVRPATAVRLLFRGGNYGPLSAPGVLPERTTLGPVAVRKSESTTDVKIVGKRRVGMVPSAWFTVRSGDQALNGWVTVTGAANKPLRLRVRDGFAKVDLGQLRAGKHTITANFAGNAAIKSSRDKVTFKLKKAKSAKAHPSKKHHRH